MANETYGAIKLSDANAVGSMLVKKMGGVGYAPKEWADVINLMGKLPEKTVSGAIASFADGADDVPLKELIFSASPVQVAGTPSPSNPLPISGHTEMNGVHCGKNLIKPDKYQAENNQLILGQTDNTAFETFLKAGTYTISYSTTGESCYIYRREENDGSNTNLGKATSKTFTISEDGHFRFWLYGDGAVSANISDVLLEVGSSASTYVPFSSGTKKWSFPPFGKNLIDDSKKSKSGGSIFFGGATSNSQKSCHLDAGTYTITIKLNVSANLNIYVKNLTTGEQVSGFPYYNSATTDARSKTFTIAEAVDVCIWIYNGDYSISTSEIDFCQIEFGSSSTSYEPYQSMFVGSVNALTGAVQSRGFKRKIKDFGTWNYVSQYTGYFQVSTTDMKMPQDNYTVLDGLYCEVFNPDTATHAGSGNVDLTIAGVASGTGALRIKHNSYTDVESFLRDFGDCYVIYPLIVPIETTLDSVDWQTQLGINNFYNDCGDSEVTYRRDITLALQESGT